MYDIYDRSANWLVKWGTDKYLHLIVCLLLAYITSGLLHLIFADKGACAVAGFVFALCIGVLKEALDRSRGGKFDVTDLYFDAVGAFLAMILYLVK